MGYINGYQASGKRAPSGSWQHGTPTFEERQTDGEDGGGASGQRWVSGRGTAHTGEERYGGRGEDGLHGL